MCQRDISGGKVVKCQIIMLSIALRELASLKVTCGQKDEHHGSGYWDIVKRLLFMYHSLV